MRRLTFLMLLSFLCSAINVSGQKPEIKILHNHIGYETLGAKHGVILGHESDRITVFKIMDYATGQEVLSGKPEKVGAVDNWRNWCFWTFDFDEVETEGTYFIECSANDGVLKSFPFIIQNDILERNTLSNVLNYFKIQRTSGLLNKADSKITFSGSKEGEIDVSGGWYDATGDYSKLLSHLAYSTYFNPQQIPLTDWSIFKTYEILEERGDPNFRQYNRRLLDEAMYGADYLVRVKNPEGSFYRSVASTGVSKRPEDRRISPSMIGFRIKEGAAEETDIVDQNKADEEDENYETGYRGGAGVAIASLAIASTFEVSGDFENADYLKAAEDAFAYLEENNVFFTNDGKENIVDDYCALMAATELFKATKKESYKMAADKRAGNLLDRLMEDGRYNYYWCADDGDRPFYHASDAGLPVVSLLYYLEIADEDSKLKVLDAVKKNLSYELDITAEVNNPFGYGRQFVQTKSGERSSRFFYPHDSGTAPWWQGENARLGSLAAAARLAAGYFKEDQAFYERLQSYGWDQLNWILGLNPFDACMLEGQGRNNVPYMYFGSYEYTATAGGICNGITAGLYDETDIDLNRGYLETGKDNDWRWAEQWLPHSTWYLIAIAIR